jgi:hypothetical protein
VTFNLPSNSLVSLLKKSEFAAQILGFEKLGLGLDNCGRTTKNAYCPILWDPPSYEDIKKDGELRGDIDAIRYVDYICADEIKIVELRGGTCAIK